MKKLKSFVSLITLASFLLIPVASTFAELGDVTPAPAPTVTAPAPDTSSTVTTSTTAPASTSVVSTTSSITTNADTSTNTIGTSLPATTSSDITTSTVTGNTSTTTDTSTTIPATPVSTGSTTTVSTSTTTPTVNPTSTATNTVQTVIATDTTPPIISGISTASVSETEMTILWYTDELATSALRYGTTTNYGMTVTLGTTAALVHTATILNLQPNTTYHYCIDATDLTGNTASSCGHSFTTPATQVPVETNPPVVVSESVSGISTNSATISWITDEIANGTVEYGPTSSYGFAEGHDTDYTLNDSATLTGLNPNTTYHYHIKSRDVDGNMMVTSDNTFTTNAISLSAPATTPVSTPVVAPTPISAIISNIDVSQTTDSTATIVWTTSVPANSQVSYGNGVILNSNTVLDQTLVTSHSVTLTGLSPNTLYSFEAKSQSSDTNSTVTVSSIGAFTTLPLPVPITVLPSITIVDGNATGTTTALVSAITDTPTTATLHYGMTTSYESTLSDITSSLNHSFPISNLTPATTYHYQIQITDASGTVTSSDATFTTNTPISSVSSSIPAVPSAPTTTITVPETTTINTNTPVVNPTVSASVIISNIQTAQVSVNSATVTWDTDLPSDSQVAYGDTTSLGNVTQIDSTLTTSHSTTISNLAPNTNYYFVVQSKPVGVGAVVTASTQYQFNTLAEPIQISTPANVSAVAANSVIQTSATVFWNTDIAATSQVQYGITTSYGLSSAIDATLVTSHTVPLANLTPSTTYHFRVKSVTAVGDVTYSDDGTFITTAISTPTISIPIIIPTPVSATISNTNVSQTTDSTAAITWTTDIPASSQMSYGAGASTNTNTTLDPTLVTSHSVTLTNLSPNTLYSFEVKSQSANSGSTATISPVGTFSTLPLPVSVTVLPSITSVSDSTTGTTTASVSVVTDTPTTAQIEYGTTTSYGQILSGTTSSPNDSFSISNLDPNTSYHYEVVVTNSTGTVTSPDETFTTNAPSVITTSQSTTPTVTEVSAPTATSDLSISAHSEISATLSWNATGITSDGAMQYDIRYSVSPITGSNFANATQAQVLPITYADLSSSGTERNYVVAGLDPGTTYYFGLESKYEQSAPSDISNVVMVTTNALPQSSVSAPSTAIDTSNDNPHLITATGANGQIIFNWNNPTDNDFVQTRIVRKLGGYPTSESDGQFVYEGNGETFADTSLTNGTTYYYSIFAYSTDGNYSVPVNVSFAPIAGNNEVTSTITPALVPNSVDTPIMEVYQQGSLGSGVLQLQTILKTDTSAFINGKVDGSFGSSTTAAVKLFQKDNNLPQTGVTDTATQNALNNIVSSQVKLNVTEDQAIFDMDLHIGSADHEDIGDLQEFLQKEGSYQSNVIDSKFGPRTAAAVKTFQAKYNLGKVDGYVGPETRNAIRVVAGM